VTPSELLEQCRDALRLSGEADADVHASVVRRGCARFAIGELSQHMGLEDVVARVRVAKGRRVAEVATTDIGALRATIAACSGLAAKAPEIDGWDGVAPAGDPTPAPERWSPATAEISDEDRATLSERAIDRVARAGLLAAGMLETQSHTVAVASTRGAARVHEGTTASFKVWALDDPAGRGSSGHAFRFARDVVEIAAGIDEATDEAIAVAKRGAAERRRAEPGAWDLVLEGPAIAELLEWLGMIAFSAGDVEQGRSPLAGRIGQAITGERISIVEDPLDEGPMGFADPFDRDGTSRRRVELVSRGVARGVLYDRVYSARARRASRSPTGGAAGEKDVVSTGSARVPDFGSETGVGPVALHLAYEGADAADTASLIAGMKRGLWIRRLHYVNGYVETRRAVMTGLSRDGCFLVEDGRVVCPVFNVRMTDSFLEMLARADGATRERVAVGAAWAEGGTLVVPRAIRIPATLLTA